MRHPVSFIIALKRYAKTHGVNLPSNVGYGFKLTRENGETSRKFIWKLGLNEPGEKYPREWQLADIKEDGFIHGNECPSFHGDGLVLASCLADCESGDNKLWHANNKFMLVCYNKEDLLSTKYHYGRKQTKIRVRRATVIAEFNADDVLAWVEQNVEVSSNNYCRIDDARRIKSDLASGRYEMTDNGLLRYVRH